MRRKIFLQSIITASVLVGCATVHQVPFLDREMMSSYNLYDKDESGDYYFFEISIDDAVESITTIGFNLEIPFYYPAFDSNHLKARIFSGPFVARCKEDCDCGKEGASGHGAESATGSLLVEMETRIRGQIKGTAVKVSSMFYRTQSTDSYSYFGTDSSTRNLYFQTLGRIEEAILEGLGKH